MEHQINIEGIRLYAFHGCLEEEARIGGNYQVDVRLTVDFTAASESDELSQTIDYCAVYDLCRREMAIRSRLIEHVCRRIHEGLKAAFPAILYAHVKVTKIAPPLNGDVASVSVEIKD